MCAFLANSLKNEINQLQSLQSQAMQSNLLVFIMCQLIFIIKMYHGSSKKQK